jgi:hypothetical protein
VAYQTAWTMAHKLRHGLSEDPSRPLRGFLEADETFIGGRGDPTSRGRSTANPDKSLVVAAVERMPGWPRSDIVKLSLDPGVLRKVLRSGACRVS